MTGHEAYHGSVVAENLEETLPLGGIGRLVAVTGNDETNLLAGVEFSHAFGRANVFHLKPQPGPGGVGRQGIRQSVQARILSREGCHYEEFERRFEAGADVAVTRLTEVFTYGDFVNEYDNPIELFTIRGDEFRVVEEGAGHHPAPGDIIVSVVGGTNVSSTEKSDGLRARPHRETRAYDGMERLRMVEVLTEEPS